MGRRGRGALVVDRKPQNSRPNARQRRQIIEEGSSGYWDLIVGDGRRWLDRFDGERERAWRQWQTKIFKRWKSYYGHYGQRPDGWLSFELPRLIITAWDSGELNEAETADMGTLELVYRLAADDTERAEIEAVWDSHLRLVGAARARKLFQVPAWYINKSEAARPAEPERRPTLVVA